MWSAVMPVIDEDIDLRLGMDAVDGPVSPGVQEFTVNGTWDVAQDFPKELRLCFYRMPEGSEDEGAASVMIPTEPIKLLCKPETGLWSLSARADLKPFGGERLVPVVMVGDGDADTVMGRRVWSRGDFLEVASA